MIQSARERTRQLLEDKREQVELVAQQLLEKEILTRCATGRRLETFLFFWLTDDVHSLPP